MDDTENNLAEAPELSTPEASAPSAENEQPSTDESDGAGGDLDTQGTDTEFEEVDYEGKRYSVPKEVKDALLRQADYTRKTQELAQTREQAQAEIAVERARIEADKGEFQAAAQLMALESQIKQYQAIDWRALMQSDPQRFNELKFEYDQLKEQHGGIWSQVEQRRQQKALQEQQETARSMQQANEVLGREIKQWSPEYAKGLREVAKSLGASDKDLDGIRAPWIVRALHAQKVLSEMTAKAQKATPAPAATPVKTITGGAAKGTVDPDKLPIGEWMRMEQARMAKLRRR